jgi:diaminopimelate epimerase
VSSNSVTALSRNLRIFKYQALGNSYLILDPRHFIHRNTGFDLYFEGDLQPSAHLVRILCDKSYGIGSNGLLFGPMGTREVSLFRLRIINSDGTPAGFSGNGVRIFTQYLRDADYVRSGEQIRIEITDERPGTGPIRNTASVRICDTPEQLIEVSLPHAPRFGANLVAANPMHVKEVHLAGLARNVSYSVEPLAEVGARLTGLSTAWSSSTLLDIGNPHCVTFVEKGQMPRVKEIAACDEALREIAFRPATANRGKAVFANGANLQWAYVTDRARVELAIYERGEGPTTASGSSASAAACAAFARGLIDPAVEVIMQGGTLAIRIDGTPDDIKTVTLSGYAIRILDGFVDLPRDNCG